MPADMQITNFKLKEHFSIFFILYNNTAKAKKGSFYMEMNEKRPEPMHPFVDIDGFIAEGKQFDLDITLANDHRDVIYGVIRDCFKEPVRDAVV